jgi:beta-1,2-mannobiose phosphorylase / 1,2-beta-oligomannan phosphorylase
VPTNSGVVVKNKIFGLGVFETDTRVNLIYVNSNGIPTIATSEDGINFSLEKTDIKLNFAKDSNKKVQIRGNTKTGLLSIDDENIQILAFEKSVFEMLGVIPGKWRSAIKINEREYLLSDERGIVAFKVGKGRSKSREEIVLEHSNYKIGGERLDVLNFVRSKGKYIVFCNTVIDGRNQMGVVTVSDKNEVLWQSLKPIMGESSEWPVGESHLLGVVNIKGRIISYWQVADWGVYAVIGAFTDAPFDLMVKPVSMSLQKASANPILSPKNENAWEAFNTFNPAAIYEDGKVHLVYRAQGYDYVSVLGYASSGDGINVDERLNEPAYIPTADFEWRGGNGGYGVNDKYVSGGGYGGCEDPRLTKIGDRIYMTYIAFDGWSPPRVALTSIKVEDFLAHRWLWERPVLITRPGEVNKNCVIFPRKIRDKYVIIHRVFPDILLDYVDDLDFDGTKFLQGQHKIKHRPKGWDSRKLGAGAPPIETPEGWLLIYQAVDERDAGRYKIGAMLLDLEHPEKVIARPEVPVLEPNDWYENQGFKAGVAYPCGAVVIGDNLHVYYGGADSVVCVASVDLKHFLSEMIHGKLTMLDPQQTVKIF